jgi:3-phenylpropionate/trans-cinnamate dioxygenase ferredoxin subunit
MGKYINIGKTSEFKDANKKRVSVEGQEILLAKVDNHYYAVANRCPHMKGDLSAGKLDGNIVTCPRHGSQFDIRNGQVIRWLKGTGLIASVGKAIKSPKSLQTYKVKLEDDNIMVDVQD